MEKPAQEDIPTQAEKSKDSSLGNSSAHTDELPFSDLVRLYVDLRNVRTQRRKRERSHDFTYKNDTRYGVLTRTWMKICEKVPCAKQKLASRSSDGLIVPAHFLPPSESFKIICLIIPELDSTHAYLGMKEVKLADAFIRALDIPVGSEDAQWLKRYKERAYRPAKWRQDASIVEGDFPSVLTAVLKERCPSVSSLTVGKVWSVLDMLSQSARVQNRRIFRATHSADDRTSTVTNTSFESSKQRHADDIHDKKHSAIASLVQLGTAEDVSEVARIILKDMNMHLSLDNFLNWFHPAAKQHFTQIHDVPRMLKDCYNPSFEIGEASVQIGRYASVMLTMRPSRKNLPTICEKLRGSKESSPSSGVSADERRPYFIMEPKLDGERMQLHKWHPSGAKNNMELRTFTRKGNDSSAMYADALYQVVKSGVCAHDVILDGEIMIWDDVKATWLRFEDMREVTTSIARQAVPEGRSYTLKYMVFDVLFIDQDSRKAGNMVMRFPLRQRRELLDRIVQRTEAQYTMGAKAVIEIVGMERGHDETELTNALQRYETLGYEGVIAKNPDMPYVLAERNLDISIKLKPDYFDGGIQDVDVLILGAKFSSAHGHRMKRAGKLSSFLVGVRASDAGLTPWMNDMKRDDEMKKTKWIVVGSVGSGYSDKDLEQIHAHLESEWRDFDAKSLPEHFEQRSYPSVVLSGVAKWVQPRKSLVLTIRAFEVIRRVNILRFPRVERVNWEKPYYDVTTLSHLLDLDENKLPAYIKADEGDIDDVGSAPQPKKRKTGFDSDEELALQQVREEGHQIRGGRAARAVIASAVGADISGVERLSDVMREITFHVVGSDVETKERVEIQIHELGGTFVQNLTPKVDFVICLTRHDDRVRRLRERVGSDHVNPSNDRFSIIEHRWITECHSKLAKLTPCKNHVVFANKMLEAELFKDCDRFGDWWEKDADLTSFEYSLLEAEKWENENSIFRCSDNITEKTKEDIDKTIAQCERDSGLIFKDVVVAEANGAFPLSGSTGLLRAFGARVLPEMDGTVTHVLVHSSEVDKWKRSDESKDCFVDGVGPVIITDQWVRQKLDSHRFGSPSDTNP